MAINKQVSASEDPTCTCSECFGFGLLGFAHVLTLDLGCLELWMLCNNRRCRVFLLSEYEQKQIQSKFRNPVGFSNFKFDIYGFGNFNIMIM